MKKAIIALLMVLCAVTLFAATQVQTIVLVSVVEELIPEFFLEETYIENGYVSKLSRNELLVGSHDVSKDVEVGLCVNQLMSRYQGDVRVTISAEELHWKSYHTEGLEISGQVSDVLGRHGLVTRLDKNSIVIQLNYSGKTVNDSSVADVMVRYNGNSRLPQGDYVSHITMVVEAN